VSWNNSASTLTRSRLDGRGSILSRGRNFVSATTSKTGSRAHPVSYAVGTRDSFPRINRPECKAEHLPPSSAEVKNVWSCISTPPYITRAWCLIKHTDEVDHDCLVQQPYELSNQNRTFDSHRSYINNLCSCHNVVK
jgi:hypothetical protein